MKQVYFDAVMQLERLHRLFFDVVKAELDRSNIKDINNMQCFILYNIGENSMTVGEISNRGYYMGSNVTYNLKKLVEQGYVVQAQSEHDRRSSHIHLSDKGLALFRRFDNIFSSHADNLRHNNITETELKETGKVLNKLESFWRFSATHSIKF